MKYHPQAARLMHWLTQGRVKLGWWSTDYRSSTSPVIIGGAPRTGSTLLRVMLDQHSQLWIGPENGVFQEGGRNLSGMAVCSGLSELEILRVRREAACLGDFVERFMKAAMEARAFDGRWGIKSPSVVFSLEYIFQAFPRAQFIHTVRDGRDVVCSIRTHPKYRVVNGEQVPTGIVNDWDWCVRRWMESVRAALKWKHDERYTEVRYEEVVADSERVLRACVEWLGLPYEESMLDYHRKEIDQGVDSPHPGISRPVNSDAQGRWRHDLTREALAAFDDEACALLVEQGYAKDDSWKTEVEAA